MQEKEYERYEEIGNWDFSNIKYTIEQESSWNFFEEIKKHTNKQSLILDLGTGGGEKALNYMPDDVGMIIATDFSQNMIETANRNKKKYPNKKIKFVGGKNGISKKKKYIQSSDVSSISSCNYFHYNNLIYV